MMMPTPLRPMLRYLALTSLMTLAACQHTAPQRTAADPVTAKPSASQQAPAAPAQQTANAAPIVAFYLAQPQAGQGLAQVRVNPNTSLYAVPRPVFTQADLQQVLPMQTKNGQVFLRFDFTQPGAAKLTKVAREAAGNYLIVSIRGKLVAVPKISGSYPEGKLPVPVKNIEEAKSILQQMRQGTPQ